MSNDVPKLIEQYGELGALNKIASSEWNDNLEAFKECISLTQFDFNDIDFLFKHQHPFATAILNKSWKIIQYFFEEVYRPRFPEFPFVQKFHNKAYKLACEYNIEPLREALIDREKRQYAQIKILAEKFKMYLP